LREDNLTLAIANAAKAELESYGHHIVVMTRTGPDATRIKPCGAPDPETDMIDYCNDDLRERIAMAQKAKSRAGDERDVVFVSIHTNGGNGRYFRGRTQTFYCRDEAGTLADRLLDEITALVPPISSLFTGGYQDCDLAVIDQTAPMGIPGSLIEVLYHSDLDDEALLSNHNILNKLGYRISQAVRQFINVD
jgi:N-acetylmuramoyl-L-alanine amidase